MRTNLQRLRTYGGGFEPPRREAVFVEQAVGPRLDWELVREKSGLLDDPPDALLACIAVPSGEEEVSVIMVWESAGQRGDWAAEIMMPLFEAGEFEGTTTSPKPVKPISMYLKP